MLPSLGGAENQVTRSSPDSVSGERGEGEPGAREAAGGGGELGGLGKGPQLWATAVGLGGDRLGSPELLLSLS